MDRLLSEQAILQAIKDPIKKMNCRMSNTELLKNVEQAIKAIPSAQDDDYVMIKRTTWEKIEKALDSVSARGC